MGRLLPGVHRLLVFCVAFVQKNVEHSYIRHIAIALKLGADLGSQQSGRHIQRVQSTDFRHLDTRQPPLRIHTDR